MEYSVKTGTAEKQKTACLIAGVYQNKELTSAAAALNEAAGGAIAQALAAGDIKGKTGDTLLLHRVPGLSCERLLLVGCGKGEELNETAYRKLAAAAMKALAAAPAKEAVCTLNELPLAGRDVGWKARVLVEAAGNALYRFDRMKGAKARAEVEPPALERLALLTGSEAETKAAGLGVREAAAINAGVAFTKDLANLPGNICTPTYLAEQARELAGGYRSLAVEVLDQAQMEELGMGALLSVAKGSRQPPKLITVRYQGASEADKPVVLVGKGLTFDAGGISLKPGAGMDEMKYDMSGGAAVLGTLKAVAELGLAVNLVGVVPASENLPDGAANKPGDIVTSMSGQTIEVLNTDAEGRLILCDALTYSARFGPAVVIDIATLTGACVVALGKVASGLFANNQELADTLLAAAAASGDKIWQMPLWEDYQDLLKSPFADMANIGGPNGGAVTAACFLSRYTKEYTWAHLDVAGTAWLSGNDKGATGRPVPLLVEYLLGRAGR